MGSATVEVLRSQDRPARSVRMLECFGIRIGLGTAEDYVGLVQRSFDTGHRLLIPSLNMHGIYMWFISREFRRANMAGCPHIDGTPVYWLARLLDSDISYSSRVSILDMWLALAPGLESSGRSIYILGYTPQQVPKIEIFFCKNHPSLRVKVRSGYFDLADAEANESLLKEIGEFGPDVLLVGMGMGRQEAWIMRNWSAIRAPVIITVGAFFELMIGELPIAPRWMSRVGLEWLFRLVTRPSRTAKRYIVEPFLITAMALRHCSRYRGRPDSARVRKEMFVL